MNLEGCGVQCIKNSACCNYQPLLLTMIVVVMPSHDFFVQSFTSTWENYLFMAKKLIFQNKSFVKFRNILDCLLQLRYLFCYCVEVEG